MDSLKSYILHHPTRIKYGLIVANIFIILITVRIYINYIAIEDAIESTIQEREQEALKTAFTQQFLLNYEKSEYASYFLQHENNILGNNESIVKFEKMPEKIKSDTVSTTSDYDQGNYIKNPEESRIHFLQDKLSKIN